MLYFRKFSCFYDIMLMPNRGWFCDKFIINFCCCDICIVKLIGDMKYSGLIVLF